MAAAGALELLTVLEEQETAEAHLGGGEAAVAGATATAAAAAGSTAAGGSAAAAAAAGGDGPSVPGLSAAAVRRQQLEDVLRLRFGYHLFSAGDYDEALTQLSMCSDPDPLLLLRLYPQLVPAKFVPLLPTTVYGEQLPDMQQQQLDAAAGDTAAAADPTAAGDGSNDSSGSQAEEPAAAAAAAATAAVSVVVPYLLSHRTRLLGSLEGAAAAMNSDSSSSNARSRRRQQQQQQDSGDALTQSQDPPSTQSQHVVDSSSGSSGGGSSDGCGSNAGSSGGSSKSKSLQELRLLATVIDTAILRAMLLQPDSGALLRLLQQPNYVDLEDGETVLEGRGRYAELAALYQYHRKHEKGLRLLQALSQAPGSLGVVPTGAAADLKGLPGVWAAVRWVRGEGALHCGGGGGVQSERGEMGEEVDGKGRPAAESSCVCGGGGKGGEECRGVESGAWELGCGTDWCCC